MKDVWLWILSVLRHWIILASGGGLAGIFIILVSIAERYWGYTMPNIWYFPIIIFIFILIASYLAWKDEHTKTVTIEKQLMETKIPKLIGNISYVITTHAEQDNKSSIIFLRITITNTGAPSIAKDFVVSVIIEGKRVAGLSMSLPQEELILSGHRGEEGRWKSTDFLPTKAMSQPIAKGGGVEGFVMALIRNVREEKIRHKGIVILHFKDVIEKDNTASYDFSKSAPLEIINSAKLQKKSK